MVGSEVWSKDDAPGLQLELHLDGIRKGLAMNGWLDPDNSSGT